MDKVRWAPKRVKGRLKEIRTHMGQFDFTIWTVVGPAADLDSYIEWRHECLYEKRSDKRQAMGLCFQGFEDHGPIIWLPKPPRTAEEIGTLAHEACHALVEMMDWMGTEIKKDTDEILCHGVGHIVSNVLAELRKR